MAEIESLIGKQHLPAIVDTLVKTLCGILDLSCFTPDRQLNKANAYFGQCLQEARQQKLAEFIALLKY